MTRIWQDEGIVPVEPVRRIVLALKFAQSLQAPWFITIHGVERLVARGVVYVCRRLSLGLASIPQTHGLVAPFLGKVNEWIISPVELDIEISRSLFSVRSHNTGGWYLRQDIVGTKWVG